jgi:hypothetical protein
MTIGAINIGNAPYVLKINLGRNDAAQLQRQNRVVFYFSIVARMLPLPQILCIFLV